MKAERDHGLPFSRRVLEIMHDAPGQTPEPAELIEQAFGSVRLLEYLKHEELQGSDRAALFDRAVEEARAVQIEALGTGDVPAESRVRLPPSDPFRPPCRLRIGDPVTIPHHVFAPSDPVSAEQEPDHLSSDTDDWSPPASVEVEPDGFPTAAPTTSATFSPGSSSGRPLSLRSSCNGHCGEENTKQVPH